jgi:hypothetical protein
VQHFCDAPHLHPQNNGTIRFNKQPGNFHVQDRKTWRLQFSNPKQLVISGGHRLKTWLISGENFGGSSR